jgi:hypothetical protein
MLNLTPISRRDQSRKKGLVVETLAPSINRKLGSYGRGDMNVSSRYHNGKFLLEGPY